MIEQVIRCPKCSVEMKIVSQEGFDIDVCPECKGIWVDNIKEKQALKMQPTVFTMEDLQNFRRLYKPEWRNEEVKYFKCPHCSELMYRKNFMFGSGIIVDACRDHGKFFDEGELEKAIEYIKKGGVEYDKLSRTNAEIVATQDKLVREINRVETTMYRLHWIGRFLSTLGF